MMDCVAVGIVILAGIQAVVNLVAVGDKVFRSIVLIQPTQDVIEGAVFKHEVDDVFDVFHGKRGLVVSGTDVSAVP